MIKKIAIIGGGTAGWLAANHLGKALQDQDEVSITLIESPSIPTIGVGEGTVPSIRKSLQKFGISESDFISQCDVTFKQSIKFKNWLNKSKHGENYYHHLFDHPCPFGDDLTTAWLAQHQDIHYADFVSKQSQACERNYAPKTITTPEFIGINGYAYHFDALKFAKFLAAHAKEKFKVGHIQADIKDAELDEQGYITHLITQTEQKYAFDFIIDCTGFSSAILGDKLGVSFISKAESLLTDSVLTIQVPTESNSEIPPYTIATAHQAGWIWDIALTSRRGVGFVYSSKHMTEQEARRKLAHYLGVQSNDVTPRHIRFTVGRRERFWEKNCVAIGLSQGFVEPLEATAILIADFSADLLSKRFPQNREDIEILKDQYNHNIAYIWEQTFDFVKMHYSISDRNDSQFWLDNRDESTISTKLISNLKRWKQFPPIREDFESKFDLFDFENYLYVLYGMKYITRTPHLNIEYKNLTLRQSKLLELKREKILSELPAHRLLLEKIKKYGLQKS